MCRERRDLTEQVMPAEEWKQPGEGGLAGVVCWLTMTNQGCFMLAGVTPWDA